VADKRCAQYVSGQPTQKDDDGDVREAVKPAGTRKNAVSFMRLRNFYRLITGYSKGAPRSENQLLLAKSFVADRRLVLALTTMGAM
jgi:hypothetical protein